MSTVTRNGVAHPEPPAKECRHVPHLDPEALNQHGRRSSRLCWPAFAGKCNLSARCCQRLSRSADQRNCRSCRRQGNNSAVAWSRSIVLTSRLPWLAPVGHRQPRRADVPQSEAVSAWERQQHELDQELDRKLIICRGC